MNQIFKRIADHNSPILATIQVNYFVREFTTNSGELFSRVQDSLSGALLNISRAEIESFGIKTGDILNGEYNRRSGYFSVIEKVADAKPTKTKTL